jgi:hypothetical protein
MREMQFEPFEAGIARADRGGDEIGRTRAMSSSVISVGTLGRLPPNAMGEGAMVCQPRRAVRDMVVAFPRPVRAGLAAGMADLDARYRAGGFDRPWRSRPCPRPARRSTGPCSPA